MKSCFWLVKIYGRIFSKTQLAWSIKIINKGGGGGGGVMKTYRHDMRPDGDWLAVVETSRARAKNDCTNQSHCTRHHTNHAAPC